MQSPLVIRALGILAVGSTLALSSTAHALYDWQGPASLCQPAKGDISKVNYSSNSLFNESTTSSAKVYCAVPYELIAQTSSDPPNFEIGFVDRSTSSSRVSCTLMITDATGFTFVTATKTSPQKSSSTQFFIWDNMPDYFNNGEGAVGILCTLPAGPSSSSRSGVRTVRFFR